MDERDQLLVYALAAHRALLAGIVTEPYLAPKRKSEFVREARLHLLGYTMIFAASVALDSTLVLTLWLAPMITMKFVHQLQNTIEHLGLSHEPNVLINTRSTRANALLRWVAWQMQYHTAHHAFPGVPFHHLRELHEEIFTKRGVVPPTMTYVGFQAAVLRAFAGGRTEADYPDDRTWIDDRVHG